MQVLPPPPQSGWAPYGVPHQGTSRALPIVALVLDLVLFLPVGAVIAFASDSCSGNCDRVDSALGMWVLVCAGVLPLSIVGIVKGGRPRIGRVLGGIALLMLLVAMVGCVAWAVSDPNR
jgi:hypothetical protein